METVKRSSLFEAKTDHIHQCVSCGAEIPCESPEEPQDCLVTTLTCGSCDDTGQSPDDLDFPEAADGAEDEWGESLPDETAKTRAEASDDDFFDALLREEDRRGEDSFGSPQVKPRDAGPSAFKTNTKTKKGRRGKR